MQHERTYARGHRLPVELKRSDLGFTAGSVLDLFYDSIPDLVVKPGAANDDEADDGQDGHHEQYAHARIQQ